MFKRGLFLIIVISIIFSGVIQADSIYMEKNNLDKGIVSINKNSNKSMAVRVTKDSLVYDYVLDEKANIPLQLGNGKYEVLILENVKNTKFKQLAKETIELQLDNENDLYLQSIQMINWDQEMEAIKKAAELTEGLSTDIEKIEVIYDFIVKNIKYDYDKAKIIKNNYLPNIDKTLLEGRGICYDYSSLLAAMLRSQGIKTKLVMGNRNDLEEYHSWNEVYLKDKDEWIIIDSTYDSEVKNPIMIKDPNHYVQDKVF